MYIEPKVVSKYVETPGTISLISAPRLPAFIGEGKTYYEITEYVYPEDYVGTVPSTSTKHVSAGTDTIRSATESVITSVIKLRDELNYKTYTPVTDYSLSVDGKSITWSGSGDDPASTAKNGYYVTYQYAKVAGDYVPKLFRNMDDVTAEYGDVVTYNTSTSAYEYGATNDLTIASKLAFEQGASVICCCQVSSSAAANYNAAIDLLREEVSGSDVDIILPLTTTASVINYALQHCNLMSTMPNTKERFAMGCLASGTSVDSYAQAAAAIDDERLTMIAPPTIALSLVGPDNLEYTPAVPGYHLGAIAAGKLVGQSVAEPLTYKPVAGSIQSLGTTYKLVELNTLAANGVCAFKTKAGVIRVHHGVTTSTKNPNQQEISVVQIKDYVIKNVRSVLESNFIATKQTAETPTAIETSTKDTLAALATAGVIIKYGNVKAEVDETDPRRINLRFDIYPSYPLNWIYITFSINTKL